MPESERLRVGHVITRMIVGGAQETVLLAAALADRSRFDPVVLTGPQTGPEGSLHEELARRGVEVVRVPELVREVDPRRDVAAVRALAQVFRAQSLDVVHTNSSKAGVVGRLAARRARVKRVLHTVHGWPFHAYQSPVARTVWRSLERRCAPLAERLIVVADADRDTGLAAGVGRPEQYVTVRSGLELGLYGPDPFARAEARAALGLPPDACVLIAVNRLSPQKDPATLLEAVAPLLRERADLRLLIVGDGPLRSELDGQVRAMGVEAQVVLAGLRRDVPRLLAAADLFVSASRWEGLPRTVLQAMATRLPVVATSVDGVRDVVADGVTGWSASPGSARDLEAALRRALADPAARAATVDAAAAQLPEFDARRMVRDLERLYEGHWK